MSWTTRFFCMVVHFVAAVIVFAISVRRAVAYSPV